MLDDRIGSPAIRHWTQRAARGGTIIAGGKPKSSSRRRLPALAVGVFLCAATGPLFLTHAAVPQDASSGSIRVEASPQLFATVGALFAAGFDRSPNASSGDPLVARLRALQGPATEALRAYFRDHSSEDPAATISRYVTFALIAGPPPKFELTLPREELPPDVLALDGFGGILANFYQEAGIEALWREIQPRYEQSKLLLREPLGRVVLTGAGYLRELVRPGPRTFTVYAEPLVGGQTHVRNVGDHYAVVVNPAVNSSDDMRHAFLHFLLDPLVIRYREQLLPQEPLFRAALRAPRLPESLRRDSLALFTECLVQAAELRLRRLPAARLAGELDRAEGDGLVLVRPLMAALAKFEAAEPAMGFYYPDLLRSMDVYAEQLRLQTIRFAPASDLPVAAAARPATPSSELDQALADGDRLTAARDAAGAAAAYERALSIAPGDPRALYGFAVASVLLGQGERAYDLFTQVVSAESGADPATRPDPVTLAWAHVYLGRMHDLAGEREQALAEYRGALAVAGAPEAAREAAQRGVEQAYQPAVRNPSPG
ncbi:MAG TPA: tetratricopeptide repeat protein [Candidatus Acidoferrales bacterium]